MKKLIALFAVSALASTSAIAGVALSGSSSVTYDDNGSTGGAASDGKSATTYDADLTLVGTAGGTTFTYSMDLDNVSPQVSAADMSSTIGPITIAADMHQVVETTTDDGSGYPKAVSDDTGVTISLDAPIGDATIALDNSGNITVSGTWSGVTVSHTAKSGGDTTTGSASIAGMDISVTNKAGATTWSLGTTVSGVDLTLNSSQAITAAFGLTGNTMTISHIAKVAEAVSTATTHSVAAVKAYSTVAISRDLTSGAALSATYSSADDSLTLKASVAF